MSVVVNACGWLNSMSQASPEPGNGGQDIARVVLGETAHPQSAGSGQMALDPILTLI